MQKRHKDLVRTLVIELRHILVGSIDANGAITRGDLDRQLERLGIAPESTIAPLDVLAAPTSQEQQAYRIASAQLAVVAREQRAGVRAEIIERAAYTWINRLLALRTMETRGLIDETLRLNPDYDGIPEALFILRQSDSQRASGADGGRWTMLEQACVIQANALPGLFSLEDPNAALRPGTPALLRCMTLVGGDLPGFTLAESDAAFADPDAIGWAYQFYQEEAKARTYAKLGSGGKAATRAEIAAATQLFTEPYMVKWLLQNSLGRSYHEIYPQSALPAAWEYYVQPGALDPTTTLDLASLTLLDPCVGSGHFLREAFDMFVAMYREQAPTLSAAEMANRILSRHLHGIDLDPRAAQLAALTLYLRAWELLRDERRRERKPGPGSYTPSLMNLATTPASLNEGAMQRHLQRHPHDAPLQPLLEGIFASLEQAEILGSLLRPKEYLDHAIAELQRPHTIRINWDANEQEQRQTVAELVRRDPTGARQMLMERLAESFKAESGSDDDVSAALFGREAEQGVRLLQLLDRRYAVVVTNPPYMGSKNMDVPLKKYVEKHYPSGKRDLYAAFILRCLELCHPKGRVAMVTMQSWMFLRSYTDLRVFSDENLREANRKGLHRGLLRETSIEGLVHLGRYAFSEIGNAVVAPVLFIFKHVIPIPEYQIWACRLSAPRASNEQAELLQKAAQLGQNTGIVFFPYQRDFLSIPETPIVYWLNPSFIKLLGSTFRLHNVVDIHSGLATADNERFLRQIWEVPNAISDRWQLYAKGGGYRKWIGFEELCFDYRSDGSYFRVYEAAKFAGTQWDGILGRKFSLVERYMQREGLVYTQMARGCMGPRFWPGGLFDVKSIAIHHEDPNVLEAIAALLSSRYTSYILRSLTQNLEFHAGYTAKLPLSPGFVENNTLASLASVAKLFKSALISLLPTEKIFNHAFQLIGDYSEAISSLLSCIEYCIEAMTNQCLGLSPDLVDEIYTETGIPVGLHPLIAGYDTLPSLPTNLELPLPSAELQNYLMVHKRINPNTRELALIKSNLRSFYEAGSGLKDVEQEKNDESPERAFGEEEVISGAYIPIPTETFLEELSVKMQLHPISVHWLLEELKAEGVRSKPEELRLLEDRLSVLVLRLLGHRWPRQLEAGEPVSEWAVSDGILPLVPGTGKATAMEHLRARLRAEDGDVGVQQTEALLMELTGMSLGEWLRRRFFVRHVSQFKHRPVAWHLASTPIHNGKKKRGGSQGGPAFECLLYYHACAGDALARIRTQYIEPLLRAERQGREDAYLLSDETSSAQAHDRIQELEAFAERLRSIEEQGFACPELDELIAAEPLDRWSGDGYLPPASRDGLLRGERAWHVDVNDGVRVNIAPLQLAGALASDVLKASDAKKALADRARWRADERHWVRDGMLPRCGWMGEQVPESRRWTEREPERAAEQSKLEQKRRALQSRQAEEVRL